VTEAVPPAAGTLRCPKCGATVAPEQDWCLDCGLPARTVVAPTPPWRTPVAVLATVAAVALAALAVAFVDLTADPAAAPTPPAAGAPAPTTQTSPASEPSQAQPTGAQTVTTPGSSTPVTQPGQVTVERKGPDGTTTTDQPPATAP
jgi:hypothetical protein